MTKSTHLHPQSQRVSPEERAALKRHKPLVIWFTGLSGSGKSTLANALEQRLNGDFQAHTFLLDGDHVRTGLNADLGFSDADRAENIRRVAHVARLMYDAGLIVLTAFISPFRKDRDQARELLPPGDFWEVFVDCPLEVCQQRDPKSLYKKARNQEISQFTGLTSPYEAPAAPELILRTDQLSVEQCVEQLIERLLRREILQR